MLSITTVKVETRNGYVLVKVSLENQGASVVGPGTMLGRQTLTGGAVRPVEFPNSTSILPGCTAKVNQLLSAMRDLEFTGYRQSDGVIIPFSGGMLRRLSFLRSVAEATARWWNEVLQWSTSIVVRLRALHATAWIRLAIDRRVKHGAGVAAKDLRSINAEFGRWRGEVLQWSTSIVARLRALHATAWMRLAIDRRVKHGAEVAAKDWRSINAEFGRWRGEVLLPRIRSIGGRFKALHENAWLRLAEAKQKRHRDEMERQVWQSIDTEAMRRWSEVLLSRTTLMAARFKALHENARLRLAEAKQKRQLRDQVERHAWESIDAEILRWWNEVLLPRIRFYRRPN